MIHDSSIYTWWLFERPFFYLTCSIPVKQQRLFHLNDKSPEARKKPLGHHLVRTVVN